MSFELRVDSLTIGLGCEALDLPNFESGTGELEKLHSWTVGSRSAGTLQSASTGASSAGYVSLAVKTKWRDNSGPKSSSPLNNLKTSSFFVS